MVNIARSFGAVFAIVDRYISKSRLVGVEISMPQFSLPTESATQWPAVCGRYAFVCTTQHKLWHAG